MATSVKTIQLEISGMTCDHCARSIEKMLSGVNGVIEKSISYPESGGQVRFDSSKVSPEDIKNAIDSSGHYKVEKVLEPMVPASSSSDSSGSYDFDLIIIGGGSAAFSAANTAGELGKKKLMINGDLPIGGTCVNVGCVPSKYLIRVAESVYRAEHAPFRGLTLSRPGIRFSEIIAEKKELVELLRDKKYLSVASQIPGLTLEQGIARLKDAHHVEANGKIRSAHKIIIATGAKTFVPPIKGLRESGYLTNRSLFELKEKPESLTILGAGYIGLEIAQTFSRFGSKVRIIEFTDRPLRSQTPDISAEIRKYLEKEGIEFFPNYRIDEIVKEGDQALLLKGINRANGEAFVMKESGNIVLATGLAPNTEGIGLEEVGVERDARGFIIVDAGMHSSAKGIYAAGDCANTPAFVYTAAKEGKIATLNALENGDEKIDYSALPWVVFTDPQVAGAGMDEQEAETAGIPYEVSVLPLSEVPRAQAARDARGFIKLIRNKNSNLLIGARIVAPEGGELAMQASLAIKYRIPVNDLAEDFFPYLTLSEGIKLAAITFEKDVSQLSCCAS